MTENDPVPGNEIPKGRSPPPNILRRRPDLAPNAAATPPVPSSRESDRLGGAKAPLLSYASVAPYPRKQAPTEAPEVMQRLRKATLWIDAPASASR